MVKRMFTAFDPEVYKRAKECIAQGALTNSKRQESFVKGVYPTHLARGSGCCVWDTNSNCYIDFIGALGTSILGYNNEEVNQAIINQLSKGTLLSLGTELELNVAEKVKELFPFIDKMKFLKTGTEATTAALIIARAFNKRELIFSEGYHGWTPEFVSLTPPANGIIRHDFISKLISLDQINDKCAAVIIEPIITNNSPERFQWLIALREKCTRSGTLLIFDEIVTGFRFPKYSVSQYYNILPDIICLGKAITNGMPLSVVAGKKDVMDGDYFVSGTYFGETLSLAAAFKTITLLQIKYDLSNLWSYGKKFIEEFNAFWPDILSIEGYPTRGVFKGELLTKALFWQEACKAGILFGSSFFFNFSHIDHIDSVLSTCRDIISRLKTKSVKLEGELPKSPFSQQIREAK